MDENRALFRALSLEKLVTALFIGLITFVAGLNILVVLTMTVTDRARDIAVLMAMGARRQQVRKIFILQGLVVSVAGTVAGLAARLYVCVDREHVAIDSAESGSLRHSLRPVPRERAGRDLDRRSRAGDQRRPRRLLPARSAARILPVEILRFE